MGYEYPLEELWIILHLFEDKVSTKILHRNLSLFSYLFIYIFIYIAMNSWIFILYFGLIQYYAVCGFKIVSALTILGLLDDSCIPLVFFHQCGVINYFSIFLLSGTVRCSGLILYFSCIVIESVISARIHDLFCWRMVLETKIWNLSMSIAIRVTLLLHLCSWQTKKLLYMYAMILFMFVTTCMYMKPNMNLNRYV